MTWTDAIPNLLIGLREGLEAGLVVSILLAALRKAGTAGTAGTTGTGAKPSSAPVWLGVLGAVSLAGSFAAVLTFSTSVLSSRAQEAVGGLLSVLAVCLVTGMIFWMRRTAASLSAHLKGGVQRAAALGAGALTVTAFLAVGREGLETTLFLWTAAKASGQTAAPLAGAAIGLAAAVALCWLLYRRAVKLNIRVFFNRTALALIVIAAGVLAYGLGDLQDAGLLPGQRWIAFDLTGHIDPGSWWVSIITGVTELSPKMTAGQVVAWLAYLAVVVPAFVNAGRSPAQRPAAPEQPAAPSRWVRLAAHRTWSVAGILVAVPALAAGTVIAALPVTVSQVRNDPAVPMAVKPVTVGELTGPNKRYEAYAAQQLAALAAQVDVIQADLRRGDLVAARRDWLTAQLGWERVGASYDSFGALGTAVDGLPEGLPDGVNDKNFTGLHRLEYGLWHGQSAATLERVTATLARNVATVRQNLTSDDLAGDPTNLPVRAHEILEDALRDHLSGMDDEGGGAAFAQAYADLRVTRVALGYLAPLVNARQPSLLPTANAEMNTLQRALDATRADRIWDSLSEAPLLVRQRVDASIGSLLETLDAVPDLLEVPRPAEERSDR